MAHTPSQLVLLNFTSQPSPFPLPSSEGKYTRNSVHVYDGEEPYSDPAVYEIYLPGVSSSSSVAHHTCPLYVFDLPCYCVIPVVAQTITPQVTVVHAAPSHSAPAPAPVPANDRSSSTHPQKDKDLKELEQSIISSPWHAANSLEPTCGSPNCPYHADLYGTRGLSCYTAFVDTKPDGTFGCWYEACSGYSAKRLEDALRHQRANHFNHKPYLCVPTNGAACSKRFFSPVDLQSHQRRCH